MDKHVSFRLFSLFALAMLLSAGTLNAQGRFLEGSLRPTGDGIPAAQKAFEAAAFGKSVQRLLLHGHHWNIQKAKIRRNEDSMSIGGILTNDRNNNLDRHRQYQIDLRNDGTINAIRVGEQGRMQLIEPAVSRAFGNYYQRQPVPTNLILSLSKNLQTRPDNSSWEFASATVVSQIAIRASALFRNHVANRMDVLASATRQNKVEGLWAYGYYVQILQPSGGQRRGTTNIYTITLRIHVPGDSPVNFGMELVVNKPERSNINAQIQKLEYNSDESRSFSQLSGEVAQNMERYIGPNANFINSPRIRSAIGKRIDEIRSNDLDTVSQKTMANLALRLMRMEPY